MSQLASKFLLQHLTCLVDISCILYVIYYKIFLTLISNYIIIFLNFHFGLRHSLHEVQNQYSLPCNAVDNRQVNNWSVTQSFCDSKHYAKHSYNNNNNSSHLRMINEVA